MHRSMRNKAILLSTAMMIITIASARLNADTGTCGGASTTLPFTDVPASNIFFCAIAEAYFSGLTNGTGATTYSPSAAVPREQMAAFITRTMDQSVKRSSKRAALRQFWTTPGNSSNPPSTIPEYMAVIVSSSVQNIDSVITGNVKKIIIIKTNPGYGPSPGHWGTGQVVAILCDSPGQSANLLYWLLQNGQAERLSLWKAADLTPLSRFESAYHNAVIGACSDGINFWITLRDEGYLARF